MNTLFYQRYKIQCQVIEETSLYIEFNDTQTPHLNYGKLFTLGDIETLGSNIFNTPDTFIGCLKRTFEMNCNSFDVSRIETNPDGLLFIIKIIVLEIEIQLPRIKSIDPPESLHDRIQILEKENLELKNRLNYLERLLLKSGLSDNQLNASMASPTSSYSYIPLSSPFSSPTKKIIKIYKKINSFFVNKNNSYN
ncbi:hypothetical protein DLAC_03558 [Tieghemostelium lacteum]|uniref:Uncharacterized protein n=1 Tax=Tieghemostelium lacteum TaxID=361077 RepID=A0A152A177_TIELA|nr:hypothetical protein DLAC_03558 [Tieghemostelium lacteum]|eukprot:KYQ99969.1 hypothetical protein DLAC_03558 [Tieghemostelium lacteum]